jgi:hypothetical protein
MRRTGNDFASPATAIEACGRAGMTKEVALMKNSRVEAENEATTVAGREGSQ